MVKDRQGVRAWRRAGLVFVVVLAALAVGCDDDSEGPVDAGVDDRRDTASAETAHDVMSPRPPEAGIPDAMAAADAAEADTSRDLPPNFGAQSDANPDRPATPTTGGPAKIDLIVMVDNSNSMAQEQQALAGGFPAFMSELTQALGGPADLHIAVISSNVGAGSSPQPPAVECPIGGDRGAFQVRPGCGLSPSDGYFLKVDPTGKTNFEGAGGAAKLPQVFACMAQLGINGCGFEHQLLSLHLALDGKTNPATNNGFLRDDAVLAVIILSDEDDCSGPPNADFYDNIIFGQAGSFRCAMKGHVCDGKPVAAMRMSTPLSNCQPASEPGAGASPSRLVDVGVFVDALKALKRGREDRLFVGAIIGWDPSPGARYVVEERQARQGGVEIDLAPICSNVNSGEAAVGLRLHAFAQAFANHTVNSICAPDLRPVMGVIGRKVAALHP